MRFMQQLQQAWQAHDSLVCVGLDPDPKRFPPMLQGDANAVFMFCAAIVDATADLVCAFKPQIAHFAALGAEDALQRLIAHIHAAHPDVPVILDAKRGDIGSTAQHYAEEAFDRYQADAVTANPYLGHDSIAPFLERTDKGVILLCRTSNPGGANFQNLDCGGQPLYLRVAETIATRWNAHGNCALVAGATFPEELGKIRHAIGDMPLLVPGIGAQGGDVEAVLKHGLTHAGTGLIVSSSRAILYAGDGADYAQAARHAAQTLRDDINLHRQRLARHPA
ncbi:MAG TPA: orotidine-5'-phosphate decarboxylase [Rhodanobacteraceae bacterium]